MDPDGPVIDDFRPADLEALLPMWRASFEHGVGIVDPHPIEDQAAYFQREVLPRYRVRVARTAGGTIVGFLAANAESVAQLHVHVDHLRRGIGSRLLSLAQRDAATGLWLMTFARNRGARAFYEQHGFVATAFGFEPFWQLDDVRYEWVRRPA